MDRFYTRNVSAIDLLSVSTRHVQTERATRSNA